MDHDKTITEILDSISISNGIVWSADKKTMYYNDTPTRVVQAFDYDDATGEISNGRVAIKIPDGTGSPDGMAIDEEGMLWVALWGGNCVARFDPSTGKLIGKIDVPAPNVTSCAFGGPDLRTLYITTARLGMNNERLKEYPLSGNVFSMKTDVRGVRAFMFEFKNGD
jgi:sugar lactone lactonase YvrE